VRHPSPLPLFLTKITPASVPTTTTQAQRLSKRFSDPALYEVMRIIPLTLRITHYSRAPAAWPGRPTIHVAGDWHTATAPPELARVRGKVEMVASGDVRWTLVRSIISPCSKREKKKRGERRAADC
jgi:hypothetical protein